jgi:hypothetical protein
MANDFDHLREPNYLQPMYRPGLRLAEPGAPTDRFSFPPSFYLIMKAEQFSKRKFISEVLGFHGGECEYDNLLGFRAV